MPHEMWGIPGEWHAERRLRQWQRSEPVVSPSDARAAGTGYRHGAVQAFWDRVVTAAEPAPRARAKSVIMIFNCGAPSHTDLWDMKPHASSEVRGEFSPIDTNVPGIQISELLPNLAKRMDQLAIVRTVHHSHGGHNSGMYWSIVGKPYRVDSTLINPGRADVPSFGTLVGWLSQQAGYNAPVPPYVIIPFPHCDSFQYLTPGQFGGCLGSRFDPFVLNSDPNAKTFQVPGLQPIESISQDRMSNRGSLLASLEQGGARIDTELARDIMVQREKAFGLLESRVAVRRLI